MLTKVIGIGNDFALDEGIGMCGKGGQSVPAGVGQPTLLVERADGGRDGGSALPDFTPSWKLGRLPQRDDMSLARRSLRSLLTNR